MTNARRLQLLREYAMLSAQVLELQRQMAAIEAQFSNNAPTVRKGRFSTSTKVGRVRAWIIAQKGEFTVKDASAISDRRAVQNACYNLQKQGKLKRVGFGRYKVAA